jgi:branched-chain amino acid transport system ATP-binding protein
MLEVSNLSVTSDGKVIARDVSFTVAPGEVTALLGPNGAGKSEIVLTIAGMQAPISGTVRADGIQLTAQNPSFVRKSGVAVVPEGHVVLTELSVVHNLQAAGSLRPDELKSCVDDVFDVFPELAERKSQLAGSLSGGQQQMLAIGHALVARPKYLIIDEMSLGLAPLIVKRLINVVVELKKKGVGVVLIEQFAELALSIAENALVLRNGEVRFSGAAEKLLQDPKLLNAAYFGQ